MNVERKKAWNECRKRVEEEEEEEGEGEGD